MKISNVVLLLASLQGFYSSRATVKVLPKIPGDCSFSILLSRLKSARPRLRGGAVEQVLEVNTTKGTAALKLTEVKKGNGLNEKLSILKHLDQRKVWSQQQEANEEQICGLPSMIGKQVVVLMTDGRNMYGILEAFDRNTNLMLQNVTERVFPKFDIVETTEDLEMPVPWPVPEDEDAVDWVAASGQRKEGSNLRRW
jgi:small nuclear ribonucleoprotein (snRNP)-like protein